MTFIDVHYTEKQGDFMREKSPARKQKPLCRLTFLVVLSYNKEKTTAETTATNR